MRLVRSHGLGNDYLVLDSGEPLTPEVVRALCDRHRGVGGDGVLEPLPSDAADWGLRIWNPDGSQAEKSGNGLRIFARWAVDHRGAARRLTVQVPGGIAACRVHEGGVTVDMGQATFEPAAVPVTRSLLDSPVEVAGALLRLTAVGLGNPHCVVLVEEEPDACPWREWGRALVTSPLFPRRANVQVARVLARDHVRVRVWERGAGETLASGSSACAVAAAAVRLGRTDRALAVEMAGGLLRVEVSPEWDLRLDGPVEEIGVVEVTRPLPWSPPGV